MLYTTKDGDRLDNLAYKYFGNPYLYDPIIRANPSLVDSITGMLPTLFSAGVPLDIPFIIDPTLGSNNINPPWQVD